MSKVRVRDGSRRDGLVFQAREVTIRDSGGECVGSY
jgi:hypothetical protein